MHRKLRARDASCTRYFASDSRAGTHTHARTHTRAYIRNVRVQVSQQYRRGRPSISNDNSDLSTKIFRSNRTAFRLSASLFFPRNEARLTEVAFFSRALIGLPAVGNCISGAPEIEKRKRKTESGDINIVNTRRRINVGHFAA